MDPIKLITLFLLILLIFSSVFPAIKIHSCPATDIHDELVNAQSGETIEAVHLIDESRFTTIEMLANSPES